MRIKAIMLCLIAAASMLATCGHAHAQNTDITLMLRCENASKKIVNGIDSINIPGWKLEKLDCTTGNEPSFNIIYVGPDGKKVVFNVKSRRLSMELMESTEYFTIGYRSERRKEQTSAEVEALAGGIADVVRRNESSEIENEFLDGCSRNPEKNGPISNFEVKGHADYLFHKYDEQIIALLSLAQKYRNTDLFSFVYISRYLVVCPVILVMIIVLMVLYIKICLTLHKMKENDSK